MQFHLHTQELLAKKRQQWGDQPMDAGERHNRIKYIQTLWGTYFRTKNIPADMRAELKGNVSLDNFVRRARLLVASTLIGRTISTFDELTRQEVEILAYSADYPASFQRMVSWGYEQIFNGFLKNRGI